MRERMEWAMRVFGNPSEAPVRFVLNLAEHPNGSGKMYRVLIPRVFVPQMLSFLKLFSFKLMLP